jgi:hypothetical protein
MNRLCKVAVVAGMVALLLVTSVVTACGGGGEKETNTITLGWLGDQTGATAGTFKEVIWGMEDFLAEMEATDPIPGVKIEIISFDTRLEYGRMPLGYEWLMGEGMDVLMGWLPNTSAVTQPDQAKDQIPILSFVAYPTTLDSDWCYGYSYPSELEGRGMMDYVLNTWWPAQGKDRPLKLANVGNPGYDTTEQYKKGFDYVLAKNPGKTSAYIQIGGPTSQSAWASEVNAIKDYDAILLTTASATSTGTFLKEASLKGFTGQIIASSNSVLGSWTMISALVPKSSLNGMLIPHFFPLWSDGTSYSDFMTDILTSSRPADAEKLMKGTTWVSGWMTAQIISEAVRDAADEVGAKNVNGAAINDALLALDIEIDGMPNITLANSGTHHVFMPHFRMIQYDAAADEWSASGDWYSSSDFVKFPD